MTTFRRAERFHGLRPPLAGELAPPHDHAGLAARDNEFFDADVAIATGQRTGDSATMDELQTIASGTSLPVAVGSGVTPDNVGDIFTVADAVIVASYLKHEGAWWNPVDPDRLQVFMQAVEKARS